MRWHDAALSATATDATSGVATTLVKVDDGAERAYQPVVVEVLRRLGAFGGAEVPAAPAPFHRAEVRNTNQHLVGEVKSVVKWPA